MSAEQIPQAQPAEAIAKAEQSSTLAAGPSVCACDSCKGACTYNPGWFKPGEAERVAAFLGLTLQELFTQKLGVNYWTGDTVFVLAPAITSMEAGQEYPYDPRGTCVFFQNGKCQIHPVKPFECREYMHGDKDSLIESRHESVANSWRTEAAQKQIEELLGREPIEAEGSFFDLF